MSQKEIPIHLPPETILNLPLLNKGTAFTEKERDALGLHGFLPHRVLTVKEQIRRTYHNFSLHKTALEKYVFLMGVMNRNELLFYQFVAEHAAEVLPIIYTPTVGEAAIHYSQIYFRERALYLSYPLEGRIEEILSNYPHQDVQVIVVTDGERILGLGDLGVGGIVIPMGKLSLYTLFGGIHPAKTLPIVLDVGTNNKTLLEEEFYLGWKSSRITGKAYDHFIETFVRAVKKKFPKALLQWEDFGQMNARPLLDRYRDKILSFNDDIQGTAAVVLSAIFSVLASKKETLQSQKIAILGAGSAGTGIADALVFAMEQEGISRKEALEKIWIVDKEGLLHESQKNLFPAQRPFVKTKHDLQHWKVALLEKISMQDVIENVHPTILIGVSGQAGAFTKSMIESMVRFVKHPVIFPLSNPTSKTEALPQDLLEWTQGKALIATGSPFAPVMFQGAKHTIGQCNNVYIFPGLGTGALAAEAKTITDGMFLCASKTLAQFSPLVKNPQNSIFPAIEDLRSISQQIAIEVAKQAILENVATIPLSEVEQRVSSLIWTPHYPCYTKNH